MARLDSVYMVFGEAGLVNWARMKFRRGPNGLSLASALSGKVDWRVLILPRAMESDTWSSTLAGMVTSMTISLMPLRSISIENLALPQLNDNCIITLYRNGKTKSDVVSEILPHKSLATVCVSLESNSGCLIHIRPAPTAETKAFVLP